MFQQYFILLSIIFLSADCKIRSREKRLRCTTGVCERPSMETLRFFLIGDTGGLPIYPYTTYAQHRIAKALSDMGSAKNTHFQISLGDNIYYTGVQDVFDHRFQRSFESVYSGSSLRKPWYMIAGNHDHFGNISAQVKYTNQSSRWTYPSLYYKISYAFGAKRTVMDVIMIDTMVLCGNTRDIENGGFFDMIFADKSSDPDDPKDLKAAQLHLEWIEQQLNQSSADYLFVAGHYPVYSVSSHGPMSCLQRKIEPLLNKYKVTAYFSGHDHTLQHLAVKDSEEKPGYMHYIISGAASRTDLSGKHEDSVPAGSSLYRYPTGFNPFSQLGFSKGGFILVEISPEVAEFKFYDGESRHKYDCSLLPRKRL